MRLVRYNYTQPSDRTFSRAFPRSPWGGLETEIDRLFGSAFSSVAGAASVSRSFPLDLYSDQENNYVRAELPGVKREAIQVEVVDGYLIISVRNASEASAGAETEASPEKPALYRRSVNLADAVQADKIGAAYENGVLTVTLPKPEVVKPKKVTVSVK